MPQTLDLRARSGAWPLLREPPRVQEVLRVVEVAPAAMRGLAGECPLTQEVEGGGLGEGDVGSVAGIAPKTVASRAAGRARP